MYALREGATSGWALSPAAPVKLPRTALLNIDASAATQILIGVDQPADVEFLRWDLTALGDQLLPPGGHALVIGAGGGRDLWAALLFGAAQVDGVEVNPIIADDVMRGLVSDFSGQIYSRPGVRVTTGEGRSFVRRSDDKCDLIQASLVDTRAASAAGAFALSENSLYTVEAFVDYFRHLTPAGVLSMSRWTPESLRVVSLARGRRATGTIAPSSSRQPACAIWRGFTLAARFSSARDTACWWRCCSSPLRWCSCRCCCRFCCWPSAHRRCCRSRTSAASASGS